MASTVRSQDSSIVAELLRDPSRFSFFQAVRLLTASAGTPALNVPDGMIGTTRRVSEESIRFSSKPTLRFAAAEVTRIHAPSDSSRPDEKQQPVQMEVSFWGLIGPAGTLPNHYTQLVIDRQRAKDTALRDFLDLFSHRQLSLFYRAWEKHCVAVGFETAGRTQRAEADSLREVLLSIVGLGTRKVQGRLACHDDLRTYFGGMFVDTANAESLHQLLHDFLQCEVEILSLFGQWLQLPLDEQTQLGQLGGHCALGVDTVMGERVWDASSKFRIVVGPLDYQNFRSLMPTGDRLTPLAQLTRSYVGMEFDFDVQVVLRRRDIPNCVLTSDTESAQLGWNTWLLSETPQHDSYDAVFSHHGDPD